MVVTATISVKGVEYFYRDGVRIPRPKSLKNVVYKSVKKSNKRKKSGKSDKKVHKVRVDTAKKIHKYKESKVVDIPEQLSAPRKISLENKTRADLILQINGIAFAVGDLNRAIKINNKQTVATLKTKLISLRSKYGDNPHCKK